LNRCRQDPEVTLVKPRKNQVLTNRLSITIIAKELYQSSGQDNAKASFKKSQHHLAEGALLYRLVTSIPNTWMWHPTRLSLQMWPTIKNLFYSSGTIAAHWKRKRRKLFHWDNFIFSLTSPKLFLKISNLKQTKIRVIIKENLLNRNSIVGKKLIEWFFKQVLLQVVN